MTDTAAPDTEGGRGARVGLLAVAGVAFVLLAGACYGLGTAGYRSGFLVTTAIIGVPAALLAITALRGSVAMRPVWAVVVVLLAAIVAGAMVDHAPYSKARLSGMLDSLSMPNLRPTHEVRLGHSWCDPRCPTVVREYRSSVGDLRGPLVDLAFALEQRRMASVRGLMPPGAVSHVSLRQRHFVLRAETTFRTDSLGRVSGVTMRVEVTGRR